MTTHGQLFGAVPSGLRFIPLILILTFIGYKIARKPGAIISLLTGIAIPIAMAMQHTVDGKAKAAEYVLIVDVILMIICDFIPGGSGAHRHDGGTGR